MTIICADPNPMSLFKLEKIIRQIMPTSSIYSFKETERAISEATKKGCDVLITEIDFGRNKGEGIEMARKIMQLFPSVNVIFATSAPVREYAPLIVKIKYSGFLTKPFAAEELETELKNLRHC